MIDLSHYEKQAMFYAKEWFQKEDTLEDLKKIVSKEYALTLADTRPFSVLHFMVQLFIKLELNNEHFLLNLFETVDSKIDYIDLINKMLSRMMGSSNRDNQGKRRYDLGSPDYSILPQHK